MASSQTANAELRRGLVGNDERAVPGGSLASLTANGERRAFERIYREYHRSIYRYCLAIVRNRSDAEDALQATMAAALIALPGERRTIALRPWLFRVAHNESISILRSRPALAAADPPERTACSPDQQLEQRERLRTLVADLHQLPERQRGALVMRELSGLPYSQIGAALGCAEGGARQAVYEARVALQRRADGREMDCAPIREKISSDDWRRRRGRAVAAHLAACPSCRDFEAAIKTRSEDLRALCPPLPAVAAAGIFSGLLGANGGLGTGGGGAVAGSGCGAAGGAVAAGGSGVAATGVTALAVKGAAVVALAVVAGTIDSHAPPRPASDAHQAVARASGPDEAANGGGGLAAYRQAQGPTAGTAKPTGGASGREADRQREIASRGRGSTAPSGGTGDPLDSMPVSVEGIDAPSVDRIAEARPDLGQVPASDAPSPPALDKPPPAPALPSAPSPPRPEVRQPMEIPAEVELPEPL